MAAEVYANVASDKQENTPRPDQLRIVHLLVWTTLCATVVGLRLAWIRINVPPEFITTSHLLTQVLVSIVHAAGLSGIALLCWRWYHGSKSFPTQPGHWLLLFTATCVVANYIAELFPRLLLSTQLIRFVPANVPFYWNSYLLALSTLGVLVCLAFLVIMRRSKLWSLLLLLPCLTCCALAALHAALFRERIPYSLSAEYVSAYIPIVGGTITLACLFVVAWLDRRNATSRDWFHRAGLSTFAAATLLCVGDQIYHLAVGY